MQTRTGPYKPRKCKDGQSPPEAEIGKEGSSLGPFRGSMVLPTA